MNATTRIIIDDNGTAAAGHLGIVAIAIAVYPDGRAAKTSVPLHLGILVSGNRSGVLVPISQGTGIVGRGDMI